MFSKHRTPTIEKYIIPPVNLRYLAVILCKPEDASSLHGELTLLAHNRAWKVTDLKFSPETGIGVIGVDLRGDRAYDEFTVDAGHCSQEIEVLRFLIRS